MAPVYKKRVEWLISVYLFIYVDYGQPIGTTETLCWEASRKWVSTCSWLVIQNASRKVQHMSQAPRPWAGTINNTQEGLHGLVSQYRWDKTWILMAELVGMEQEGSEGIHQASMKYNRGFLVYVSRTYRDMNPYFKGIHLDLDSWRPYRDEDGW